jgi:hypothetical protein
MSGCNHRKCCCEEGCTDCYPNIIISGVTPCATTEPFEDLEVTMTYSGDVNGTYCMTSRLPPGGGVTTIGYGLYIPNFGTTYDIYSGTNPFGLSIGAYLDPVTCLWVATIGVDWYYTAGGGNSATIAYAAELTLGGSAGSNLVSACDGVNGIGSGGTLQVASCCNPYP